MVYHFFSKDWYSLQPLKTFRGPFKLKYSWLDNAETGACRGVVVHGGITPDFSAPRFTPAGWQVATHPLPFNPSPAPTKPRCPWPTPTLPSSLNPHPPSYKPLAQPSLSSPRKGSQVASHTYGARSLPFTSKCRQMSFKSHNNKWSFFANNCWKK